MYISIREDTFVRAQQIIWMSQSECIHTERYEFDTPGIDAHEIKIKKNGEVYLHEKI